jgi:anti-sigma regulatory factor (Ser/Thr protein kinase)
VVMGEIRAAARAYALLDPDPSRVLARLHQLVVATAGSEQLITMVIGVIDASRTQLRLAVAGHPPPLVVRGSERPYLVEGPLGPALGLSNGPWPTETVQLEPGDSVLLYSDGLVESRERDLAIGIELLLDTVSELQDRQRTPRELCARLASALVSEQTYDDVTLLAIGAAAPRLSSSRSLPADTTAPGLARQFVVDVLRGWSVDEEVVERAELCVSELVTNAVIHTGTSPTVSVSNDGESVLLTVHDTGSRSNIRSAEAVGPDGVSGRGLSLVEALARSWNVEHTTGGTSVWCELPLDPGPVDLEAAFGWDDVAS